MFFNWGLNGGVSVDRGGCGGCGGGNRGCKYCGVVATQGEHSEECNIEEGTLAEVVGEVVVRRVAEKEPEVVPALEHVGGEAAFWDMHLKGLLMGLRCRKVLHTLFWQPLPRCLFFFSSSLTFPCFHGLPCCWFFLFLFYQCG